MHCLVFGFRAAVAKYYGVGVDICPPRRGNRKGVVEKANTRRLNAGGAPFRTG
ncbi:hypothetical protein [Streptomyces sp. NBC_01264]|uniref:hypothetical protein n=1 Tax=Streptomyces sp. NBC_01264 TaxID=2903804 RepID=UPI00225786D2|nr:hypothetical protein [Streptomyces sp. NBC_01264]MCX4781631.1 hypothetical protein [Streptomyces sp. NBC_01264]